MCMLQAEVLRMKQQMDELQVQADANSGSWKAKHKQLEGKMRAGVMRLSCMLAHHGERQAVAAGYM